MTSASAPAPRARREDLVAGTTLQFGRVAREIRAEREKWKLCREICQQTPVMEQDIQKTEEHQKEVREHEHRRR